MEQAFGPVFGELEQNLGREAQADELLTADLLQSHGLAVLVDETTADQVGNERLEAFIVRENLQGTSTGIDVRS